MPRTFGVRCPNPAYRFKASALLAPAPGRGTKVQKIFSRAPTKHRVWGSAPPACHAWALAQTADKLFACSDQAQGMGWRASGSPRLGAGSNCRKFFRMPSSTSMMAAMLPVRALGVAEGLGTAIPSSNPTLPYPSLNPTLDVFCYEVWVRLTCTLRPAATPLYTATTPCAWLGCKKACICH